MRIGIFGGSFDPIHMGHIKLIDEAINLLNLDKLILVLAYASPFKKSQNYASAAHRLAMIEIVRHSKIEVSMFEVNRKGVSYTIDTIDYFKTKYVNDELVLIIGQDQLRRLHKWKKVDEIAAKVKIACLKRKGEIINFNKRRFEVTMLDNNFFNYASSDFKNGDFSGIDKRVLAYIGQNFLYLDDLAQNMLKPERLKHSMAVAQTAAQLASIYKLDARKLYIAGLVHDLTKEWSEAAQRSFLKEQNVIDFATLAKHDLHALSAYYWLKNVYLMQDEIILSSVLKHTSLNETLSMEDKVIFLSDKIAPGRKFKGVQRIRTLAQIDFEKAFCEMVQIYYEKIAQNGEISKPQTKIFQKWMKGNT